MGFDLNLKKYYWILSIIYYWDNQSMAVEQLKNNKIFSQNV